MSTHPMVSTHPMKWTPSSTTGLSLVASSAGQFLQKDLGGQLLVVVLPLEFATGRSLGSQPPVRIPPPWPRRDIRLILSRVRDIVDKVWLDPYPLVLCRSQFVAGQYNVQYY